MGISEPSEILLAVGVFGAILLHVAVLGSLAWRMLGVRGLDAWGRLAVRGALGYTLLGLELFAAGHVGLLSRAFILTSCGVVGGVGAILWARAGADDGLDLEGLREGFKGERLLTWVCVVVFVMVLVAGIRRPFMTDELEYQWAAPKLWAESGRWIASPYRLTNGPALAQMVYTVAALFDTPTAAHWTHTLMLAILLAGGASLARGVGGMAVATMAACLACPAIANEAPISYNDISLAALLLAAYVALRPAGDERQAPGGVVAAGVLLAGAFSVKPLALAALPFAAITVYARAPSGVASRVRRLSYLLIPIIIAALAWSWHTHYLTGQHWDRSGQYFAHSAVDPMWTSGAAAGRVPNIAACLKLPFVPIYASVFGQREPYGARLGLVMLVFVPLGVISLFGSWPDDRRRIGLWLLCAACAYYLILGPVAIKTRFHMFVWVVLFGLAGGFYARSCTRADKMSRALRALYKVLVIVGALDVAHVVLKGLARF